MRPPAVLSIAGSDPSGGAGIQADLKTFSALGAYGMAVLTALTAQSTRGVTGVRVVEPDFVAEQVRTLLADCRLDAVKIGMLASAATAEVVGDLLAELPADVPVVLDPVMVATSGDRLLDDDAVDACRRLSRRADLVTPNAPETAVLLETREATDLDGLRDQAAALIDHGWTRVLVKGGHLTGPPTDVYADAEGVVELTGERVVTDCTHGTGCTLSSAIAALRPRHPDWPSTARAAKSWLTGALRAADALEIGAGHGPVHHFHDVWSRR